MPDVREIGVSIEQQLSAVPATPTAPELKQLVIAVNKQVIKEKKTGSYAGATVTLPLIELMTTSVLDAASLKAHVVSNFGKFELPKAVTPLATTDFTHFAANATANGVTVNKYLRVTRVSQLISTTGVISKTGSGGSAQFFVDDANAAFLANQTRPVDDALASGSKLFPQPGEDPLVPANFTGLKAYLVIGATRMPVKTWSTDTRIEFTPATEAAGDALVGANVSYTIETEEPANGRIAGLSVDVLVTYTALRTDLVGKVAEVQGTLASVDVFGPADPLNPLGLAMYWATAINGDSTIAGTAVAADTVLGHGAALEAASQDRYYHITPVTNKKDINSLWVSHVQDMSSYENRLERVGWINLPIPTKEIKIALNTNAGISLSVGPKTITAPGALFLTKNVRPGDHYSFDSGAGVFKTLIVAHVVSENAIIVLSLTPEEGGAAYTALQTTYTLESPPFRVSEKVRALVDYAAGIKDRRIRFIAPDSFQANLDGVDTVFDGGYLGTIIAAFYGTQDAGRPLSKLAVPIINKIFGLEAFKPNDRKALTSGGVFVLEQSFSASSPKIRHEATTDPSSKKTLQAFFTHSVDSIAFGLRDMINPYLGNNTITNEFIILMQAGVDSVFKFYRDVKHRCEKYTITKVGRSDIAGLEDSLVIKATVSIPPAANNADVTFVL